MEQAWPAAGSLQQEGQTAALEADLRLWREQLLALMLRVVAVLATLVALPTAGYALYTGEPGIAVLDSLALLALFALTFLPGLAFRTRALGFLLITFVVGSWLLGTILVVGLAFLMALPVLGALLFGPRSALALLALQVATTLLLGYPAMAERPFLDLDGLPLTAWLVITANLAFVSAIMALGAAMLLQRLEASVRQQQQAFESLAASHAALQREVSGRRAAEAQNARLAQVVDQARVMVLISTEDGEILYRNRASEAAFGGEDVSVLRQLQDLWLQTEADPALATALRRRQPYRGELRWQRPDGESRMLAISLSPLQEAAGQRTVLVVLLEDVTNERLLETRLRQAQRLEASGTLAGGIAHDFNNIIAAVLGLVEDIRSGSREAAVLDGLGHIETACSRAQEIVRQMLLIGRGVNSVERRPEPVEVLLQEAMPLLRAALPSSIAIELDLQAKGLVAVHPADLNQILLNLASNAAHALGQRADGQLRISLQPVGPGAEVLTLHPLLEPTRSYVCLGVADNGCGIPPQLRERIFDPFFTTKPIGKGTGLGLPSVHGIVTSLGGDISVYSEVGRGSSFRIYLPLAEVSGAPDREAAAATSEVAAVAQPAVHLPAMAVSEVASSEPPATAGQRGRILLVDDEATILVTTARFLTRAGHQVTSAADGSQAMALLAADPGGFDLLVTDLTMPGCSGRELIAFAHGLRPELPALLTSGFGGRQDSADRELAQGWVGYLEKPYRQAQLLQQVNAILQGGLRSDPAGSG